MWGPGERHVTSLLWPLQQAKAGKLMPSSILSPASPFGMFPPSSGGFVTLSATMPQPLALPLVVAVVVVITYPTDQSACPSI